MKVSLVCLLIYARVCVHGAESQPNNMGMYAWRSADNSICQTCRSSLPLF